MGVFDLYVGRMRQRSGWSWANARLGPFEGHQAYRAPSLNAAAAGKIIYAHAGNGFPWALSVGTSAQTALKQDYWNLIQNAAAGSPNMVNGSTGLLVTTGSNDNENSILQTARQITAASGQTYNASLRCQLDNLDLNVCFGFGVADSDPLNVIGTAGTMTDIVALTCALNGTDGVFTPRVRGNGGTIADGTALTAVTAAQDFHMGITFRLSSTTGACGGNFWYNLGSSSGLDGKHKLTKVAFTAAQITQLRAWLTTAPTTICGFAQFRASTANSRNALIQHVGFEVERTS